MMSNSNKNNLIKILSFVLFAIYVYLSFYYAHHLDITMDEGTYLLKGRLFLEGKYKPFEIDGLLTNKPPFSFWLVGLSQIILVGLRSGRYFSILLSSGIFIGLWLTSNKYLNIRVALFNSILLIINQAIIIYYSRAMTEVVTAFLIIWAIYFILGSGHEKFELCIGLILSSITALTRQNLLPFFIISIFYVLWENGIKKSALPILLCLLLFIGINVFYWPSIYVYIWRPFIPQNIKMLIDNLYNIDFDSDMGIAFLNRQYGIIQELQVLFQTLRYYLIPIFTSVLLILLVDWKKLLGGKECKRIIFLLANFLLLVIIHVIAPIVNNVYLYSMPAYPTFFLPMGYLILPLCYKYLREKNNNLILIILIFLIIIVFSGYGLSLYRTISEPLMKINFPRIKGLTFQGGNIELWKLLSNKFNLDYFQLEYIITAGGGFFFGVTFIIITLVVWRLFLIKRVHATNALFLQLILFYLIFSPTKYIAGNSSINLCSNGDVIKNHEIVAKELQDVIPNDSLVYFETNESSIPLIYLTNIQFYPNLLNQKFYFRIGGDDDYLEKYGYWNENLAIKWISNADYIVLGEDEANYWEPKFNEEFIVKFDKLFITDNLIPCRDRTYLHVYKVIK